jgi:hypothetical protein
VTEASDAASIVTYRLGGRNYPLRSVAGCKVCESPSRFAVESQVAAGRTYASVARNLGREVGLSAANIRAHWTNGHMPFQVEAMRRILEQRAAERSQDIEAGVDAVVDEVALARTVVHRTFEEIADGSLRPTVADGVAAARLLHQMGVDDAGMDRDLWVEAFMAYHDTARRVMSSDQFRQFGQDLAANPLLRSLQARHAQREQERSKTA